MTCQTCQHFHQRRPQDRGTCYAGPPLVLPSGLTARPTVEPQDRACGHYKSHGKQQRKGP